MKYPRRAAALLAVAAGCIGACARTLPPEPTTANLYRDLQRVVTFSEAAGWTIDREEVEKLMSPALMSVCRVDEARRRALLGWLDARIAADGGPVAEAWRARGRDLDAVSELLELTRIRMVLARAIDIAPADCPFWLEPDPAFRGRQISDDRWQLTFGGGGKGILVYQGGRADINFGGAGRMLLGRNFGSRHAFYAGVESGASASFPRDDMGEREALVFAFDLAAPLVYRHRGVNTYWEIETGYLAHVTEDELTEVQSGARIGVAFGGRATRQRWFFPGAVFGISYERTFPTAGQGPALNTIKVGFRAAVDMDL